MQKHPNVQIIMKLFTLVMLSLVPSVTVCSGFSKEVGIYSGTYGNDDVEVFLPEEVTYHLTGGDGVFYEGAFTLDNIIRTRGAPETGRAFSPAIVHIFPARKERLSAFTAPGLIPERTVLLPNLLFLSWGHGKAGRSLSLLRLLFRIWAI